MSFSPRNVARGLQRLSSLTYYKVLKREKRFTLKLDAAKNTHLYQKHYSSLFANNNKTTFLGKKLSFAKRDEKRYVSNKNDKYKISYKNVSGRRICLPRPRVELGAPKIIIFEILYCSEIRK